MTQQKNPKTPPTAGGELKNKLPQNIMLSVPTSINIARVAAKNWRWLTDQEIAAARHVQYLNLAPEAERLYQSIERLATKQAALADCWEARELWRLLPSESLESACRILLLGVEEDGLPENIPLNVLQEALETVWAFSYEGLVKETNNETNRPRAIRNLQAERHGIQEGKTKSEKLVSGTAQTSDRKLTHETQESPPSDANFGTKSDRARHQNRT